MGKDAKSAVKAHAVIPGKLPDIGMIVWCYVDYTRHDGSKIKHAQRHPALVLDHADDENAIAHLVIAGGGSAVNEDQSPKKIYATDFVVRIPSSAYKRHGGIDQLTRDTKFSLKEKDIFVLPYTTEFFYTHPDANSPRIGRVDFEYEGVTQAFENAAKAADLRQTMEKLLGPEIAPASEASALDEAASSS